jgi:hypothetical protein
MTRIIFKRTGGFLGQDMYLDLELDTLPASESFNLKRLVQRADFFKLPENLVASSTADEYVYDLRVESGSVRHHIRTSDTGAPESLRPLINVLSTLAVTS